MQNKYVNQLSEEELMHLLSIYEHHNEIVSVKFSKMENCIFAKCQVKLADDENFCDDTITDCFNFCDYFVNVYDFCIHEHTYLIEYRKWMLKRFGSKYAEDFLLR